LANTDAFKVGLEIEQKIRQLAWPEISTSVFCRSALHAGIIGKTQGVLQ
jgi:hypothetical protein